MDFNNESSECEYYLYFASCTHDNGLRKMELFMLGILIGTLVGMIIAAFSYTSKMLHILFKN